jgi:ribosomal protein L11 methyltransferase
MLVELCLAVDDAAVFADALLDAGAVAVTIEDAVADDADGALYGEPGAEPGPADWRDSSLRVLIDPARAEEVLQAASRACAITLPSVLWSKNVDDADWVSLSQAQFDPIRISDRLWIVPSWHEPAMAASVVVRLDPGAAFGTGAHPTTRLCLSWLDAHLQPGASVLDVGCGSGILAIAAAKLGAVRVVGTDIDPQALQTARENSANNQVTPSYTDPDSLAAGTFDIVLANILANPLKLLAPALVARVSSHGTLVLSGVLERQVEEVADAYRAVDPGFILDVAGTDEGWALLVGRRGHAS